MPSSHGDVSKLPETWFHMVKLVYAPIMGPCCKIVWFNLHT